MKAVIYSRVSTEEQNLDHQVDVLRSLALQRGADIVNTYQEQETAWREGHQRELARLITDCQQGRTQLVIVWALDRLSRQGPLAILELINKFTRWGVHVLSYQEPWTEAPGELTDLLYALTGWVARMESKRRSERVKERLAFLKKQGVRLGRPPGSRDKRIRKRRQAKTTYA